MSVKKKYKFNRDTLSYDCVDVPLKSRVIKGLSLFFTSIVLFIGILYLTTSVFGIESPRTSRLRTELYEWQSKLYLISQNIESNNDVLSELQLRDNVLYRPVFGMEDISADIRRAGIGGVDRYQYLKGSDYSGLLTEVSKNLDILARKTLIQSQSFDDIEYFSERAGDMANSMPRISPIALHKKTRLSDKYGMRKDPFHKGDAFHSGIDLSGVTGDPVYATGNGKVVKVAFERFGYGNYVIVDHGFGYKTRYAHLKKSIVQVGQTVSRGEQLGELGSTGRSTGPHLHYEVIHMNRTVDPLKYFNLDIKLEDYYAMVKNSGDDKRS